MKIGTRVRMSERLKRAFRDSGSGRHVAEFGDCEGVVIGPLDYNNCSPGDPGYDAARVGPEVDVRWQPSGLRYGYHPDELVEV